MEQMKKCKYCQTDIPKKAKVCPNCKRTLKGHVFLTSLIVFIILVGVGVAASSNMDDKIQKDISGVSDESEYITKEEFNKIETGMTYNEVKKIIGSSGELTSKVEGVVVIEMYTWYGNGTAGSNANVTFQDGKVTGKAQFGLK